MSFTPTEEQQAIVEAFADMKDLVVEACAGSGKTSTLRLLAEYTQDPGVFIAYNAAIAKDAKASFPTNVDCRTAHSLAYGAIMSKNPEYRVRLQAPRITSKEAVTILGINPQGLQVNDEHHLPAWLISRIALETVRNFCNSADSEIAFHHVPRQTGIEEQGFLANYIIPFAKKAWVDIQKPDGKLKFQHDHYLKIWALTNPRLRGDFILFDEAQDANPVIAGVVANQDHMQKVYVGDRNQQLYAWRGAQDAMSNFGLDSIYTLSQSFRFGPAIAEEANKYLSLIGSEMRIQGFEEVDSVIEPLQELPDAVLCRTNSGVIQTALDYQSCGKRVAIVGGTEEIKRFAEGARELMNGSRSSHPDLAVFKTWQDVQTYANTEEGQDLKIMTNLVDNYGLPTIFAICNSTYDEAQSDVVVSTAHKSKGREWDKVKIGNDFRKPDFADEIDMQPSPAELMLLYVACTRAKHVLDNSSIAWINAFVDLKA